ncbi:MAG TPA: IS110 family transposase [Burkholderiales bacterium]|nr:IS110 family transposase [Burkholderiales bacterium]
MDKLTTIAVDIAKRVFSVYWVDAQTGEIGARTMSRAKLEEFMRTREPSRVVLEAGGSAHHWGRWLARHGHEVRLIAAQHVRPFVRTNKTDAGDARAIWEAASRPEVKWVAVKGEASQAVLGLHRMRRQLIDMRRMQSNQLKALLYEFGVVAPAKVTAAQLADWVAAGRVPKLLEASLCMQLERIARLKREELELTRAIERHNAEDALAMRLIKVPGIGALGASALSAELTAGATSYTNGRQYAACKGIAPRLSGTGGKVRPGPISKRGDPYVRTLLIHGARSVITHQRRAKRLSPWLSGLLQRRPFNVAVVALANKMARTAWVLAAHDRTYQANYGAQAA